MNGYTEIPAPQIEGMQEAIGCRYIYSKVYVKGDLRVWVTRDLYTTGIVRWHMSISTPTRYPVWNEIRDARYALMPDDITMAMLLPPKAEYVNVHPNCFHLHEIIQ